MFSQLEMAPPDSILGLSAAFKDDTNPNKINLGVGIYKDASGATPVLNCVKEAEKRILATQTTKSYLPIDGDPAYGKAVQSLLFAADQAVIDQGRAVTLHVPGGTGALRVSGDFLKKIKPDAKLWISDPTWANHNGVFSTAGFALGTYPYYNAETKDLAYDEMIAGIRAIPEGDIILLHACCHNPTGMDPNAEQWKEIASVVAERNLFPLIDFAYQGLANGLQEDTVGLRAIIASCNEILICGSFSKNFGLYNERVGALTLVATTEDEAKIALSHLKIVVRTNYSNPPSHGASIVTTVLNDDALTAQWHEEVAAIRSRIKEMRISFVETLKAKGVERDFSFITRQNGMFSFSGLTKAQVEMLRAEHAIYIVGSGRINVAGMTPDNMDHLCDAIIKVL